VDRSKYRLHDWSVETNAYILEWKDRANRIQNQRHTHTFLEECMHWYWGITRRWIIQRVEAPNAYTPSAPHERQLVIS